MNHGDNYDTHPFDILFMLNRWADRQNDVIWDPFVNNGFSQRFIEQQGYRVYHGTEDIMTLEKAPLAVTLIMTNPPYSNKAAILKKLASLDVPFVILVPTIVIQRDFFTDAVEHGGVTRRWHVALPNKSLIFHVGGVVQPTPAFKSCFIFSVPCEDEEDLRDIEMAVTLEMVDYVKLRREAGFTSANFSV